MAPPLIARSNDGSLIAIHYHQDPSSNSGASNKTSLIRCYDGNVSNGSLKFTLRVPAASSEGDGNNNNATLSKLVFSNTNSHLCVMQQTSSSSNSSILIYDLDRGVLATTLDVRADATDTPKKKKSRKSSISPADAGSEILCDIAMGSDNELYALVDINGKCRLYQYDLVGKKGEVTLVKKIKVGSVPTGGEDGDSGTPVFGLTISKDVIVVRLGSTLRVHDVNSGGKLGKFDLPSDVVMASSSSNNQDNGNDSKFVPLVITSDGRYIVTSVNNQAVVLSSGKKDGDEYKLQMVAVLSTKDDSSIVYLDGTTADDDKLMVLAFQPTVGIASLFSVSTSSGGKKKKKASSSLVPQLPQAQLETKEEEHARSLVFTHAGFHPRNPNEAMLLLFQRSKSRSGSASGSGTSLPMESLSYDADASLEGTVTVGTSLGMGEKNAKDGKKRKANENVALAPGDQGQEAGLAQDLTSLGKNKKKAKKGGDDGKDEVGGDEDGFDDLEEEEDGEPGQSIAERLALLSSAMEQTDEEDDEDGSDDGEDDDAEMTETPTNFKPNSATSETLTTLLTQALSSNDSNQLNIALQVTDRRLVEGTIRALQSLDAERAAARQSNNGEEGTASSGYISTLMAHIVRRMARRHSLVMPLGVWVKAILAATARSTANVQAQQGGSAVEEQMAREGREMAMKLGPLKNFLNERVECFPQLLRLEGRLALLSQQL